METTALQAAVGTLFAVFMKYRGDNEKLTKEQFLELLKTELPLFYQADGKDVFAGADLNEDGRVDFKEFSMLVVTLAWTCFDTLEELSQQQPK